MSIELRWQRLQDLFHAACQLDPARREAFARSQADDDPVLLQELMEMLAIEGSATARLHGPMHSARGLLAADAKILPGARFGAWEIVRAIGQGGMGQVYLARRADGSFQREVALKLVAQDGLDPRQRAFFEVERQLLGQMNHPAIAQIHDAGTDELGRPWLVMEYIEGNAITEFCEENALSLGQRIQLFLRLCEGVQHAHQQGVVHRDIKPSNVLVRHTDGMPMPCLIDFGIATGSGDTAVPAGTHGYMSPEQVDPQARVDSRSDVYSLGALLYELLSGKRPQADESDATGRVPSLRLATLDPDTVQSVAELRGLPPQRLLRTLREDLDWIVSKAMDPDPNQRYSSVVLLADDLERFLQGHVVRAAPPSRLVAMRKFMRRHRLGVAAMGVLLLALAGGLAGTTWALQKARTEAHRKQVSADFLASILSSADPALAGSLDKTLLLRVLDTAAERVGTELATDPEGQIDVRMAIARSFYSIGNVDKAIPQVEAARTLLRTHGGANSVRDAELTMRLGDMFTGVGRIAEAEATLREAITMSTALGTRAPATQVPDLRSRLAYALLEQGKVDEALEQARAGYQGLSAILPENHTLVISAGERLAALLNETDHADEAMALLRKLIATRAEDVGSDHPYVLRMRITLATFLLRRDQPEEAETELRAILGPAAAQHGENSSIVAAIHQRLGGALREQGKVEEAGPHYRFALDYHERATGPESPYAIIMRHSYANWLLADGQAEAALDELTRCRTLAEGPYGPKSPFMQEILGSLGKAQLLLGQLEAARTTLEEARAIQIALYGETGGFPEDLQRSFAQLEAAEAAARGQ